MEQDFLDEMIEESTRSNSEFPSLMEEAHQRRALLEALAAIRSGSRISQSAIAKRIKTSQSAIARLEAATCCGTNRFKAASHQPPGESSVHYAVRDASTLPERFRIS